MDKPKRFKDFEIEKPLIIEKEEEIKETVTEIKPIILSSNDLKVKKFNEFNIEDNKIIIVNKIEEVEEIDDIFIDESFNFLNESFLLDLKRGGFFSAIKRLGRRVMLGIANIIKENPKIGSMISTGVKDYGKEFAGDVGGILGEYEKKWKEKEEEWRKKEEEYKEKLKNK